MFLRSSRLDSIPQALAAGPRKPKYWGFRTFASIIACCAVSVSLLSAISSTTSKGARRPNVLLITIDTLRADHLGCYGYTRIRTPALDGLAREGIRFDRVFTPVPLTLPAHCSIMTGTYPSFHGVHDNSGFVLGPDQVTLAEVFKGAGYSTAGFIGAFVLDRKFGIAQGFDRYFDNFDLTRFENVSPGYIQRTADEVEREVVRWFDGRKQDGPPFFVWVHFYDPHDPYTPPEPYRSRHLAAPYDGEIEFTDANVGAILDYLRRHRLYDQTVIAVVGDHGESLGEHGESKHGFFAYNATLHVPLIIRLPGGTQSGRVVETSASTIDLFPTLLQAAEIGGPGAGNVQGRGLLSAMLGKAVPARNELYAECYYPRLQFGWSEIRAIIAGRHKYVMVPRPELYDNGTDFKETRNLIGENSVLANQLRDGLKALIRRYTAAASLSGTATLDSETREKLRSLGYVSYSMGSAGAEDFQKLRDPKDEIATYNEIVNLFEREDQGAYREVIPRYEAILKQQPELKIVQYKLGQAFFQSGDYERALVAFKKAIELGGDAALAVYDLSLTYMKLGRIDDAVLGLRRTIQLEPDHYRARTNLGLLLSEQGKLPEAIEQLEAATAMAPRLVLALSNLAIAYSKSGRHAEAEATMRKAVELSPKDGILHANLAAVLHRAGKEEEARQEMELARKLNPRIGRRP